MKSMKKRLLPCVAFFGIVATSGTAVAACNALINGRPMTYEECALAIQVYGSVVPGRYGVDADGNWWNLDNPMHRGNTYRDAQRNQQNNGGSFGGGSLVERNLNRWTVAFALLFVANVILLIKV